MRNPEAKGPPWIWVEMGKSLIISGWEGQGSGHFPLNFVLMGSNGLCVYYIRMCAGEPLCTCGCPRKACCLFSPATMWVTGIELRWSDLVAIAFICSPILPPCNGTILTEVQVEESSFPLMLGCFGLFWILLDFRISGNNSLKVIWYTI